MKCAEATLLLCAAEDGEPVSSGALALAHAHCDGCPECNAFRETLIRLRTAPAPRAPLSMVSRIMTLIPEAAAEAAAHAQDQAPLEQPPHFTEPHSTTSAKILVEPDRLPSLPSAADTPAIKGGWSVHRIAVTLSAAAVLVLAVGITSSVLFSGQNLQNNALLEATSSEEMAVGTAEDIDMAALETRTLESSAPETAKAAAPEYITFQGVVYVLTSESEPQESSLTTAGAVTTSLSASGTTSIQTAYYSELNKAILYINSEDDHTYLIFRRVSRTVGKAEYALVTDAALTYFGEWPTLPQQFTKPVTDDGAPSFRLFGFDDLGVNIYVAYGFDASEGIAIAPGTDEDDPAAGNPNWTWWEPVE